MKKALASLASIAFLTTNALAVTACDKKDEYVEITDDEIYDSEGGTGEINSIAFIYMYTLPETQKPDHEMSSFYKWEWNLSNRKKIIGFNNAWDLDNPKREYWKITIEKTKFKGIFVSNHIKSYEIIEE